MDPESTRSSPSRWPSSDPGLVIDPRHSGSGFGSQRHSLLSGPSERVDFEFGAGLSVVNSKTNFSDNGHHTMQLMTKPEDASIPTEICISTRKDGIECTQLAPDA